MQTEESILIRAQSLSCDFGLWTVSVKKFFVPLNLKCVLMRTQIYYCVYQ